MYHTSRPNSVKLSKLKLELKLGCRELQDFTSVYRQHKIAQDIFKI